MKIMAKHKGKWKVVCNGHVKSSHRKKSAAKKARPEGCRIRKG